MRKFNFNKIPEPTYNEVAFNKWAEKHPKIIIEIGCGVGFHPIRLAKENPQLGVLAIERTISKSDSSADIQARTSTLESENTAIRLMCYYRQKQCCDLIKFPQNLVELQYVN